LLALAVKGRAPTFWRKTEPPLMLLRERLMFEPNWVETPIHTAPLPKLMGAMSKRCWVALGSTLTAEETSKKPGEPALSV
jgi:hypothetical protein